ncbi:MAG TPA: helix-turn-helix domain-containing protein [Solirubrobacteraceae bacterium]|nr:helix-turn-helix domain-containing protein [Solirubrobacteraceae bacterium]
MPAEPDFTSPAATSLVERLRAVHLQMLDAVLTGDGLSAVADLAAGAAGGPVAVVVPRLGVAVVSDGGEGALQAVRRYIGEQGRGRVAPVPAEVVAEVPIASGDERIGGVVLLAPGRPEPEAVEFLHLAAVAALTEVAVEEAREEVEENVRGSFLEELRERPEGVDAADVVRRASRLGCDLERGAVVLCAELSTERPRHVVALIASEYPGALAQHVEAGRAGRVYALLPGTGDGEDQAATIAAARALAGRLQRHGVVALSSYYADPADLGRAIQEAELVLEVLQRGDGLGGPIQEDIGTGTYRLLFRVLASHPEEVRSFYEDTVASIVRYDDQYRTDLVQTLEAYLEHNCNMNATASAIYAHRHTVAYRLDRVKELSGLDPMQTEDRERLGLGLKAYRIIAPGLPR